MRALKCLLYWIADCPHGLFAVAALPIGLWLCLMVPPLGGGAEPFHLQRAVSIASGCMHVNDCAIPRGIISLIDTGWDIFYPARALPMNISNEELERFNVVAPDATKEIMSGNPLAIMPPLAYLPQSAAIGAALMLDAPPVYVLYAARITGLLVAIGLTCLALRIMPSHRLGLLAVALLPPFTFQRSVLDADQLTNALAFLSVALICRAYVDGAAFWGQRNHRVSIAVTLFGFAQAKMAYLAVPFLVWALPQRPRWLLVLAVGAALASFGFMLLLKLNAPDLQEYYQSGELVAPSRQLSDALSEPLRFAGVLWHTITDSHFIGNSLSGVVGIFGPPLTLPNLLQAVLLTLCLLIMLSDASSHIVSYSIRFRLLAALLAMGSFILILCMLYLQWTPLGAPLIEGFQGRYLYPILPLWLINLRSPTRYANIHAAAGLVLLLAGASSASLLYGVLVYY